MINAVRFAADPISTFASNRAFHNSNKYGYRSSSVRVTDALTHGEADINFGCVRTSSSRISADAGFPNIGSPLAGSAGVRSELRLGHRNAHRWFMAHAQPNIRE
jgi:hypothetical protein